ncbi:hypothetical protein ACWDOP_20175 [Nocardia sp. NPDC003693]
MRRGISGIILAGAVIGTVLAGPASSASADSGSSSGSQGLDLGSAILDWATSGSHLHPGCTGDANGPCTSGTGPVD